MEWGVKQRVMRAVRGMSQGDLALAAGVSDWDLSKIETGKVLPTPSTEQAIRDALGWPEHEGLAELAFTILETGRFAATAEFPLTPDEAPRGVPLGATEG